MDKEELKLIMTIEYDSYKRQIIKEKIYELLKELEVIELEMREL